jgi:hypothetical protein
MIFRLPFSNKILIQLWFVIINFKTEILITSNSYSISQKINGHGRRPCRAIVLSEYLYKTCTRRGKIPAMGDVPKGILRVLSFTYFLALNLNYNFEGRKDRQAAVRFAPLERPNKMSTNETKQAACLGTTAPDLFTHKKGL